MTSLTEALPASVRGVTFVAYSFRSGRFGSLAKFAAMRHASSRVSRRLVAERCDVAICPESGEKRKCAACTLMTKSGPRIIGFSGPEQGAHILCVQRFCRRLVR